MKIIFFSDAHLDNKKHTNSALVNSFIRDICADADMVFVLGDLFEFYHGYEGYIYPWYRETADALKALTDKGVAVYFIEGNHEFRMGGFFGSYTGATCIDSLAMEIDGRKAFVSHGYEMEKNLLVAFLKTRFIYGIMDFFGPGLTWSIAAIAGKFLSREKKPYSQKAKEIFRGFARRKLDESYDAVILAHSHISDSLEYIQGDAKKYYYNTGDIIRDRTYVEYNTHKGFEIKTYR